jgi:hypothetical protein
MVFLIIILWIFTYLNGFALTDRATFDNKIRILRSFELLRFRSKNHSKLTTAIKVLTF